MAQPDETIREVAESAMRAVVSQVTLNDAMGDRRAEIEAQVAQNMQRILDSYRSGIQVQGIAIKQADPPDAVNDAFKQVTAAQQDAQSYINSANAYALQLRQKAQGEATAFDKVYEQYKLAPEVTRRRMYYETMEQVLSKVDKTIVEAPGVTPYLPLPQVQKQQPSRRSGSNDRRSFAASPIAVGDRRRSSCCCSCSAASRSFPETKQAVVVRFGKPVRIYNQYKAGRPIGAAGAGHQLADSVRRADRVDRQARPGRRHAAPAGAVDRPAPARGRCLRPLPDRRSAADVHPRRQRAAVARAAAADPRFGGPQRAWPDRVRLASDARAPGHHGQRPDARSTASPRQYGVEIIDVRIKRTDLPDGAPLAAAFDRMRTAREQEARSIRAQGAKQAQIIRAEADAEAAKTYAASFGKDPRFLRFLSRDAELSDDLHRRRPGQAARRRTSFCRRKTTI